MLDRKNWLFSGSPRGAAASATSGEQVERLLRLGQREACLLIHNSRLLDNPWQPVAGRMNHAGLDSPR